MTPADDLHARYRTAPIPVRRPMQTDVSNRPVSRPAPRPQPMQLANAPVAPVDVEQSNYHSMDVGLQAAPAAAMRPVRPSHVWRYAAAGLCLLLLVGGGFAIWHSRSANAVATTLGYSSQQSSGHVTSDEAATAAKANAAAFANYSVAPDMPCYLRIPSLNIAAQVGSGGLQAGTVAEPDNIQNVNWYNASAKPGMTGTSLITGLTSDQTNHGVFYNLQHLQPGDAVEVERGDGARLEYRVVKTQQVDANTSVNQFLTPTGGAKGSLNLLTYVQADQTMSKQAFVVYAESI